MNQEELYNAIDSDMFRMKLADVYADQAAAADQQERYRHVLAAFETHFDAAGRPDIALYSAPGRTEIGGNHTDHQRGMVLAAAVDRDAIAAAAPNDTEMVRIHSEGYGAYAISLKELDPRKEEEGTTEALLRGVLAGMKRSGYDVGGFDACIESDVPGGSGLSSSAAFEILIGFIVSELFNGVEVPPVLLAKIGQQAENQYFGKPCGLMDQLAAAEGGLCRFDFADPEKPKIRRVRVDLNRIPYALCVTETGGSHADLTEEYAAVPREMQAVAHYFQEDVLRDITPGDLLNEAGDIRRQCGDRAFLRALHFVQETRRVEGETEALEKGDMKAFLRLFRESGESSWKYLQNVSVSRDPDHQPVAAALAISEMILGKQGVSRIHGGGFAGTIQAFVRRDMADRYREVMDQAMGPGSCRILKIRRYGGLRML